MRIVKLTQNRGKELKDIQVGFIALNKKENTVHIVCKAVSIMPYMILLEIN